MISLSQQSNESGLRRGMPLTLKTLLDIFNSKNTFILLKLEFGIRHLFVSHLKLTTKMAQNSPKKWSYLIGFGLFQYKKRPQNDFEKCGLFLTK